MCNYLTLKLLGCGCQYVHFLQICKKVKFHKVTGKLDTTCSRDLDGVVGGYLTAEPCPNHPSLSSPESYENYLERGNALHKEFLESRKNLIRVLKREGQDIIGDPEGKEEEARKTYGIFRRLVYQATEFSMPDCDVLETAEDSFYAIRDWNPDVEVSANYPNRLGSFMKNSAFIDYYDLPRWNHTKANSMLLPRATHLKQDSISTLGPDVDHADDQIKEKISDWLGDRVMMIYSCHHPENKTTQPLIPIALVLLLLLLIISLHINVSFLLGS